MVKRLILLVLVLGLCVVVGLATAAANGGGNVLP